MNEVGTMRVGAEYASIYYTLPTKFKIIRESISVDSDRKIITIYTETTPSDDGDLVWLTENTILVKDCEYILSFNPTYRRKWSTFTIVLE